MNTTKLSKSKARRDAFVASQINVGLPFQIRALRKQRNLNQNELATLAGMLQPRISAMEQVGGGQLNLDTLRKLAAALDVGLLVKFVAFSELIKWSNDFSPDDFSVPSFDQEMMSYETETVLPTNVIPIKQVTTVIGRSQTNTPMFNVG
jgi:transcriptional regulator with XRE-family HTH domain